MALIFKIVIFVIIYGHKEAHANILLIDFQGSRLTAFELVHDKVPATLIADSAAAALMKSGCIQAVIVGADRIAANGTHINVIPQMN